MDTEKTRTWLEATNPSGENAEREWKRPEFKAPDKREMSTQTPPEMGKWHAGHPPSERDETKEAEMIREGIRSAGSLQEFGKMLRIPWPSCTFSNAEQVIESPFSVSSDSDVAICVTPGEDFEKGISRRLRERHPEIVEGALAASPGDMAHITSVTRVPLAGGKTRETGRMVHTLKAKCDSSLHEALQKLRTLMEEQGRSEVALALPEHPDLVRARKIIEFAFRDSPVLVALHTQPQGTKQQAGSSAGGQKRPGETLREPRMENNTRRTKDEAILVKAEGLSYADLLKTVKKGVDPEKIGVEISNMRKT